MNGIIISIDPVIAHVGPFELRWYSLTIMLAVIAAIAITAWRAPKKGIEREEIYSLAIWAVAGGVVGARLFHVIDRWGYYAANPYQILQFQQGGLAIWGALAGGAVAVIVFTRVRHIPIWPLLDVLAPALLVAQIIGRFGCIVNGDAYGGVTSLPWAFIYTNPNALITPELFNVPTHPYPVYEQIWNLMTLAVIWQLGRRVKRDGVVFLTYLSFYSVARFLLTYIRSEKIWFLGLQEAQVVAIVTLVGSLGALAYMLWRSLPDKIAKEPVEISPQS